MKLRLINLFGIVFLLVSCEDKRVFDDKYYVKDLSEWKEYVGQLGLESVKLKNQVFLIVNSTVCPPCENELKFWDDVQHEIDSSVNLIVIERYSSIYHSFLSRLNVDFKSVQDSTTFVNDHDLIPHVPVKIFFNNNSEVIMIYPVGMGGKLEQFIGYLN